MNDQDRAVDLQRATLEQVRKLFEKMTSPEWRLALQGKSDQERADAAKALAEVQRLRLALGNAELADIRDKLVANETDLNQGIADLGQALTTLDNIQGTLRAISGFLNVVARLV